MAFGECVAAIGRSPNEAASVLCPHRSSAIYPEPNLDLVEDSVRRKGPFSEVVACRQISLSKGFGTAV